MTKKERLYKLWREDDNLNTRAACETIKLDYSAGRRYIRQFKSGKAPGSGFESANFPKQEINREFSSRSGLVEVFSLTIRTLEDALEAADVDLEKWAVERWIVNSWEVTMKLDQGDDTQEPETRTNYQVKVWLRPLVKPVLQLALELLVEDLPKFKPPKAPKFKAPSGIAGEMILIDAHMAKMAWARETLRRDHDLKISADDYCQAAEKNLGWMEPFKPEKIFYILGNDYMHVENYMGVTPRGQNPLDIDSRLPKIVETAIATQLKVVGMCRMVAPTEVIWIPGNHDEHSSLWLSHVVREHFKNDKYVTVDAGPSKRKARRWGTLVVGWAHDISRKYPSWNNELAQAFPDLWGKDADGVVSEFREWHCGHKHKKQDTKMHPILTHGGVLIRQLTALSPIDAWHFENLFTDAVPGGESLLWSKKNGVIANFTAWSDNPVRMGG